MILANFRSWKTLSILSTLVIISLVFTLVPPMQSQKNRELFNAVVVNDLAKAQSAIMSGAEKNIVLSNRLPLISLAIEYENAAMVALLLETTLDVNKEYEQGYVIIKHALEKDNHEIIKLLNDASKETINGK